MKKTQMLLLIFCLIPFSHAQIKLYVASGAGKSGKGTVSSPFGSIQQAVYAASALKADSVEILLTGGRYDISETIEITGQRENKRLIIRPSGDVKVSISGGRKIPAKNAVKVTDPAALNRVDPSVREHIRVVDLAKLGIPVTDLHPSGFGRPSIPAWTELFINGEPMDMSRWPNDTVILIGKVIRPGSTSWQKSPDGDESEFEYSNPRPARWLDAPKVWIKGYFAHGYAVDMISLASIDTLQKRIITVDMTNGGFMDGAPFRNWHAVNLLEEIDLPGEFALEAQAGKIYFYPRPGDMKEINVSILEEPMMAIENTAGVTVKNIIFEYSRGMGIYMEQTDNVLIDGCTIRNIGNVGVCIGRGSLQDGPFEFGKPSYPASRVVGSLQDKIYNDIVYDRLGGKNNGVKDCYIYNVGAGGISMGGGSRATLTPAGNFVDNCRIHDFNRVESAYRGGVNIDGVGNRITRTEIFNAPNLGILIHGNEHLIEYCDVHHVCTEIDDQGAVYIGRDPSERRNIIRYCHFHDFDSKHRVTATYVDDGACDVLMEGNIYHKAGTLPVLIGGGHDNRVKNCVFVDSPVAIHVDNRGQNWAKSWYDEGEVFRKRLKAVKHQEPPYSTIYPDLTGYWDGDPTIPSRNVAAANLFYKIDNVLNGWSSWIEMWDNWTATGEEPGFVDPSDPIKGFRPDALIFKRIHEFKPIPFEKIGCTLPPVEL